MMKLYIAGGCQEHGRNCFLLETGNYNIMVDCGIKEGKEFPYPKLSQKQIKNTRYLFLTHSHKDHAGAISWLIENDFSGQIISTEETRIQVGYPYRDWIELPILQENMRYQIDDIQVVYGRSGHCVGSIWLLLKIGMKEILFTGDYTEHSVIYACDRIRKISADCAVIDCAYGNRKIPGSDAIRKFEEMLFQMRKNKQNLLLPIPKYGRGLEFVSIIKTCNKHLKIYGDERICNQVQKERSKWYTQNLLWTIGKIEDWKGESAVLLITDPQLKELKNQNFAKGILCSGGKVLFTGHVYSDTYAAQLVREEKAESLIYPVHMGYSEICTLAAENDFSKIILNHSEEEIVDFCNVAINCKKGNYVNL